jgi:hypothetical protein
LKKRASTPNPDGRVILAIKTPWSDGTTHLELSPTDLIARLAALVCRPRANQILYMGVLSPRHRWRAAITPDPPPPAAPKCATAAADSEPTEHPATNDSWAELMQRGLQIDTLACPTCGGRFRHIANIMTRDAIRRILRHLGIQSEPPDLEPAVLPPDQPDLFA